ncbi:hypothetical protein LCGC14_1865020 [marine sediment metagenome]|uniref:Uncharacterized protein n=1 Tax=marine sediment metagenome TaxID=412755 RepID=A0A0F9IKV5_9ZZZZ|nr:hypothetical protein [bacterium]
MRRRNFFKLSILAVFIISIVGGASAYHEYVYTIDDTHTANCHAGGDPADESTIGKLNVTLTPSGDLEPYQAFSVAVIILNFTELDNSAYQNRTTIGFSKDLGDNAAFFRGVSNKSFSRRVSVDKFGSDTSPTTFGAVAPATPGTYDLVLIAVAAMNQTDESGYNITFAKGTVSVTVVAADIGGSASDPTISGGIFGITIGIVVAISTIAILQVKKRMRKKDI